jgi:hypothetical protein
MSYARHNGVDSDVYIFEHAGGFIQCCGCRFAPKDEFDHWDDLVSTNLATAREALAHMDFHVSAGDRVPERAFARIREEHPDLDAPIEPYVTPPEVRERQLKRMRELFGSD